MIEPKNGWTIITLKEHLEEIIGALSNEIELKFKAVNRETELRDKALELQAERNNMHFETLNHEAARILKATEITVSRDTWDGFLKGHQEWKGKLDIEHASVLDRVRKVEADVAVNIGSLKVLSDDKNERGGKDKTLIKVLSVILGVVSFAGVVVAFLTFMK